MLISKHNGVFYGRAYADLDNRICHIVTVFHARLDRTVALLCSPKHSFLDIMMNFMVEIILLFLIFLRHIPLIISVWRLPHVNDRK